MSKISEIQKFDERFDDSLFYKIKPAFFEIWSPSGFMVYFRFSLVNLFNNSWMS